MKKSAKKTKTTGTDTDKGIKIPCEWVKIQKSSFTSAKEKIHRKCGRYHQSMFPQVPEYGMKRWVVCGYLKIKEPEKWEHLSESEIVEGCVAFLNQPPPRKRKPLFGSLAPVPAPWRGPGRYDVKDKGDYMIVCLSTDQHRNKNFWGDGPRMGVKSDGRKTRHKK